LFETSVPVEEPLVVDEATVEPAPEIKVVDASSDVQTSTAEVAASPSPSPVVIPSLSSTTTASPVPSPSLTPKP
jgi:hypothetical protein